MKKDDNKADQAVRGQGDCFITNTQKRDLIIVAHKAYDEQKRLGLVDDESFDVFRKGALWDACHKTSFKLINQREYSKVRIYFAKLAGTVAARGVPASPEAMQSADEWRRANNALSNEEKVWVDAFGGVDGVARYVDSLFVKIHKTTRKQATAKQVWSVLFTLRNRGGKKRK